MKNKHSGKAIALIMAASSLFMLGACEKKAETVSAEDAYAQLKGALTTAVETEELSVSLRGDVTIGTPGEADGETPAEPTESKSTIDIVMQVKMDESDKIVSQSAWIKLLDEDKSGLILESYYKDGNSYSYSNFIKESYSYAENAEPGLFDPSDLETEKLAASIDKISGIIPEPKATVSDGEYTLVWTVNNDNLNKYVEAYCRIENENATDAEIAEKTNALTEKVTLGTTSLTVKIKNGLISSASAVFDVSYDGSSYKGNATFTMSVQGVTVSYPEGRLEEIKEKSAE